MKRIIFILALIMISAGVFAIPAKRKPFVVTNSDGTVLTLMLCGDENYHFYTTTDGVPVVQLENGDYRLAPELQESQKQTWDNRSKRRTVHRARKAAEVKARREFGYPSSYTGKKKGVVILVNFSNLTMKSANTNAAFSNQFNQEGYNKNDHYGSVHDYFYAQSYGQFDLTFDVYGPVTVSNKYSYYGANDSYGSDLRAATLAREACVKADSNYDIDWSQYDWDGDGEVDQVYIIYAGYGEHAGAPENTIWPHEWALSEGATYGDGQGTVTLGGCIIDTYAMSCELRGTKGSTMNGIGTACHEFSHCLGLPDFYDTSYDGGFGMNSWDLMDAGSYNGKNGWGEQPAGFSAYERWFAGWLDFTELSHPADITDMPALQDTAMAYIIYNDGDENEYFILENRQANGWFLYTDTYTSCHGMLALHVDYDESAWINNEPNNNAKHQRMSIIPAGGTYGTLQNYDGEKYYTITEAQYRSQLFPGTSKVTELTNTSHTDCGGKLFNKNTDGTYSMNKAITDITETGGRISFKFMGGADAEDPNPGPGPKERITLADITELIQEYLEQDDAEEE